MAARGRKWHEAHARARIVLWSDAALNRQESKEASRYAQRGKPAMRG